MKAASAILLLLGMVGVLISAEKSVVVAPSPGTLRVTEEHDESGRVTLVITLRTGKANANPGADFCVKIPGPEFNFKPVDDQGHSFLLSADGRTCGCIEKFAVKSYRCDAVVLTKQGTLQVYPDFNERVRSYLKAKNLPVDAEELFIESVEPRKITLGGAIVRTKKEIRFFFIQVALKADGDVEVLKSWFEKDE